MLFLERREKIKLILLEKKSISVSELAKEFNVSSETIRRDLDALSSDGFLTKSYGGAVINQRSQPFVSTNTLLGLFVEEKKRIAKKAATLLFSNDCIFIDHSTTAYYLCDEIQDMHLTVVTNSLGVMTRLANCPNIEVVSIGGTLNRTNSAFFGINAIQTLRNYHLDKTFISFRSLDMQSGISDNSEQEAELHRTVIEIARKVVLLADHTKFNRVSFVRTGDFSVIDTLVTDVVLNQEWREFLEKHQIEYFECPETSPEKGSTS